MDEKSLQRACVTMEYSSLLDLSLRTQGRSADRGLGYVSGSVMKSRWTRGQDTKTCSLAWTLLFDCLYDILELQYTMTVFILYSHHILSAAQFQTQWLFRNEMLRNLKWGASCEMHGILKTRTKISCYWYKFYMYIQITMMSFEIVLEKSFEETTPLPCHQPNQQKQQECGNEVSGVVWVNAIFPFIVYQPRL